MELNESNLDSIIEQSIMILKNMYCKAHLIHGDFSLYNLLYVLIVTLMRIDIMRESFMLLIVVSLWIFFILKPMHFFDAI